MELNVKLVITTVFVELSEDGVALTSELSISVGDSDVPDNIAVTIESSDEIIPGRPVLMAS